MSCSLMDYNHITSVIVNNELRIKIKSLRRTIVTAETLLFFEVTNTSRWENQNTPAVFKRTNSSAEDTHIPQSG